ncbi:group II intron reverse transcriptase/maturase [Cohnella luojiensis]|nr:group II intron reverse transcriptase/maturase [Cohnella luojiensis]
MAPLKIQTVGRTIEKEEDRRHIRDSDPFIVLGRRESRLQGEGMDRNTQLAKETRAGHVGSELHGQTSLQGITKKATKDRTHRFGNLYRLLNVQALKEAFNELKKKAAAGIDGVTASDYAADLNQNVEALAEELINKTYRAKKVRRVYIDKGNGKKRPLGIPAVSDKVVQRAAARILTAIYEPEFSANSYGYRPHTGAQKAVKDITNELQFGKYSYIVEADIKGYFENIDHDWLLKMLEIRIADSAFLGLIRKWLKAGIMDIDGKVKHPVTGSPQGGIISPILANIYLHYALDLWFEKRIKSQGEGEAYLCRYADDFICAFRYKRDAQRFYRELTERLGKFGLELSAEKTNLINFSRFRKEDSPAFEFLGFEFRWGVSRKGKDLLKRRTSRSKLRKSIVAYTLWCRENRDTRLRRLFPKLNAKLQGYYNYFGLIGNYTSLWDFHTQAIRILYKWLNRRSQRRSFNQSAFTACLGRYSVVKPRIVESRYIQLQFDF